MKSIFLTILIFIGVFTLAGSGILSVISSVWFHYLSYVLFFSVILCGIYVTLIRKPHTNVESNQDISPQTKQEKGEEYDKK
ncbi:MAG: hypothetical protein IJ677_06695 [Alphaproteobacteria bacterium]|nr:hypothetical protein [Alphaproteobacteria bacterium]